MSSDSGCRQGSAALQGKPVTRITFTEVTKKAVLEALAAPRSISMPLVEAYLARRALDYLLGFTVSPVLWTKCANLKSAGETSPGQAWDMFAGCRRTAQLCTTPPTPSCLGVLLCR